MSYGWAVTNALASLAASAFTFTSGPNDDTRLYLRDRRMGKQFVCTAASSSVTITVDLGTATSLKGWALLNHNLASFGSAITVATSAADDSGFSVGVVTPKSTTTLDFTRPHDKDFVLQFPAVSKRYWRLGISWTGTKTLKIGELFAYSSVTTLSRKDIYGASSDGAAIRVAQAESDNMEPRAYLLAGPQRTKKLSFSDLSDSERAELEAMWLAAQGPVSPVLFVTDVNETTSAATASEQDVLFAKLDLDAFVYNFTDYSRFGVPALTLRNLAREVGA